MNTLEDGLMALVSKAKADYAAWWGSKANDTHVQEMIADYNDGIQIEDHPCIIFRLERTFVLFPPDNALAMPTQIDGDDGKFDFLKLFCKCLPDKSIATFTGQQDYNRRVLPRQ